MLDFRRNVRHRNYLSRRYEWRLLLLVFLLGGTVLLMIEARDLRNYQWLEQLGVGGQDEGVPAGRGRAEQEVAGAVRRAAGAADRGVPEPVPKGGRSGRWTFHRGRPEGLDPEGLDAIRDDAPFRSAEYDCWFQLLRVLRETDEAVLEHASVGSVTYVQVFQQPDQYRGRLIDLRGRVRRIKQLTAPENDWGFQRYYQAVLQPEDDPRNPIIVILLGLPPGMPVAREMEEAVRITGFFFKRWEYLAEEGLAVAPVVLAKTARSLEPGQAVSVAAGARGPSGAEAPPASAEAAERPSGDAAAPSEVASLRELLEVCGLGPDELDSVTDGVPWQDGETELLLKMFFHLRRLAPGELERWSEGPLEPAAAAEDPAAARAKVFQLRGTVTSAERIRPPAGDGERFELQEYYRCQLSLEGTGQPAVVFARKIPAAWPRGESIREPAGAVAALVKLASDDPRRPCPVLVAARIAWYPATPLGRLGMDVGLLDEVAVPQPDDRVDPEHPGSLRTRVRQLRLTHRDSEPFYQLLAAVGRAQPGQLLREARRQLAGTGRQQDSVVPLFNEPYRQKGRLVLLSGTARRVLPVRLDNPDLARRIGLDHYYEIALFTEDSLSNPLVVCVRELPPGMPTGEGPRYAERITLAAFFFKTWAYRPRISAQDSPEGQSRWQLAPLLVGRRPVWHRPAERAARPWLGAVAGGLFVAALGGVWWLLWRNSVADRRFRQRVLARATEAESPGDLPKPADPTEVDDLPGGP